MLDKLSSVWYNIVRMAGRINKARALKLRRDGLTYQQIALQSGVSRQAIHLAIRRGLTLTNNQPKSPRDYYIRLKARVLAYYGNGKLACVKCGFANVQALTIGHINNDGAKHRKVIGSGHKLYRWIEKENYPEGFQTLCMNCQFIKRNEHLGKQRLTNSRK